MLLHARFCASLFLDEGAITFGGARFISDGSLNRIHAVECASAAVMACWRWLGVSLILSLAHSMLALSAFSLLGLFRLSRKQPIAVGAAIALVAI